MLFTSMPKITSPVSRMRTAGQNHDWAGGRPIDMSCYASNKQAAANFAAVEAKVLLRHEVLAAS